MKTDAQSLTKTIIKKLPVTGERYDVRDTVVRGLMIRVGARAKTWAFQRDYKDPLGKTRTLKRSLGEWPDMTVAQARDAATDLRKDVKAGKLVRPAHDGMSLGGLIDLYIERKDLSERTLYDIAKLRRRFTAKFETLPLEQIDKAKVAAILDQVTAPNTHNQLRAYLNAAFVLIGERSDLLNPVGVRPREVGVGDKVIEDVPAFWAELAQEPNPQFRLCRALTLLAGLRPTNGREIEKAWIGADRLVIPRAKMKAWDAVERGDFVVPLSTSLRAVVEASLRHCPQASPYLFPGSGGHVSAKAKNGHELRRTYGSTAVDLGVLDIIRKSLMDQAFDAVDTAYVKRHRTFNAMLEAQQRISQHLSRGLDHRAIFGL